MHQPRIQLPLVTLLAVCALLAAATGSASAASKSATGTTPCWRLVLNDEYPDGQINGRYPLHCYKQAIAHLPQDSLIYGQLKQDITRAMLAAEARLTSKGVKVKNSTVLPGEDTSRDLQGHKKKKGIIAAIADKIGPGNASSIPLPLLILAGLGLLLVAAAGASFAARWISARRNQPRPATSPPTPPRRK